MVAFLAFSEVMGQITPQRPDPGAPPAARTCAGECHKEVVSHKVMHGPVLSDCAACHIQTGDAKDHVFTFIAPKEELCIRCHSLPHEQSTHAPVRDGKCLSCHDPHGSDHPRALIADPRKDLCLKCHTQQFSKSKFVHGPVAVGACVVCHKAHSSDQPKLLIQDPKTICLTCHSEVQTKPDGTTHIHTALEQGCTGCHDPHASDHKFQLRQASPGLCLSCHKDRFDQMTAGATVIHGAISEEGGCSVCHAPHASQLPALQRAPEPNTCLKCHDKAIKPPNGAPITNMAALLKTNPDWHGPIRQGACTACHDPHAGKNFRMLAEPYPAAFYAPFNVDSFKLCFKCHIPDLVLKPTGQGLTRFRNGDKNLHWVHVNQEKGRTCRACHEVHASQRPAHIREAVPFGSAGWLLDINFQQTEDGGSCSPGCHTIRRYGRTNPSPPINPVPSGGSP